MTIIGKLLVFMVLLLSVVFNGLVVNAYVTRTNWKKMADDNKATAQKAATAVGTMQKLLEEQRSIAAESLNRAYEERNQYMDLYTKEKTAAQAIRSTLDKSMADARKDSTTQIAAQSLVDSLQKSVDNLTQNITTLQNANDELIKSAEAAKIAQSQSEIEASAQRKRAEQYADQIRKMNELVQQYKHGGRPLAPGETRATAPEGFRGTVRAYQDGYVSFTPGLDAGLTRNTTLMVYRLDPAPKYLGKVLVTLVDPKEGVGRFVPAGGVRVGPNDLPKPGDELKAD